MDDLARWLGAQLDEDERIAKRAANMKFDLPSDAPWERARLLVEQGRAAADERHIAAHDPARVLREIEAKRRIIAEHPLDGWRCATCADPEDFDEDGDGDREWSRHGKYYPCPTLRLLALPYADRPGYREDWRP